MRVACYARYSSEQQRATSVDDQLAVARRYAAEHDWTVLEDHLYHDAGVSGASIDGRPGLQALLKAAATSPRPFDVLLVDDSSRVARDLADAVRVLQQLHFVGVRVIYISQNIDSASEQAETLVAVHGVVDSLYLKEMAKKIRRGLAGQLRRGFSTGSRTYGYRTECVLDPSGKWDADGQRLVLGHRFEFDEREAGVIVRIFERYAAGAGVRAIVSELNEAGIVGPRGRRWRFGTVHRILRNERYQGRLIWGQVTYERKPGTGQRVRRRAPRDRWEVLERPELRIVSDPLWQRVQARLHEVSELVRRQPGRTLMRGRNAALYSPHLFSGFLRCGVCGGAITIVCGGRGTPRYGCQNAWRNGRGACPNRVTIRANVADATLLSGLQAELLKPETVAYVAERVGQEVSRRLDERPRLSRELQAIRTGVQVELERLVRAVKEGGPLSSLVAAIRACEQKLQQVDANLAGLDDGLEDKVAVVPVWVQRHLADLANLLGDCPDGTKAEFRRLGIEFTVQPVTDQGRPFLRAVGTGDFMKLGFGQYFPCSASDGLHPR